MKKTVFVALVVFVVAVAGIMIYGFTRPKASAPSEQDIVNRAAPTVPPATPAAAKDVTAAELAAHSTGSDCWMAVGGTVYDVTSYMPMHPAGKEAILPFCGKDGTEAFMTKGGNGEHSDKAKSMLGTLLVGNLTTAD